MSFDIQYAVPFAPGIAVAPRAPSIVDQGYFTPAAVALAAIAHPGVLAHLDAADTGGIGSIAAGVGMGDAATPRCARLFDALVALAMGVGRPTQVDAAAARAARFTLRALPFPCGLLVTRLEAAAPPASPGPSFSWVARAIALVEPLQYKASYPRRSMQCCLRRMH